MLINCYVCRETQCINDVAYVVDRSLIINVAEGCCPVCNIKVSKIVYFDEVPDNEKDRIRTAMDDYIYERLRSPGRSYNRLTELQHG